MYPDNKKKKKTINYENKNFRIDVEIEQKENYKMSDAIEFLEEVLEIIK